MARQPTTIIIIIIIQAKEINPFLPWPPKSSRFTNRNSKYTGNIILTVR